MSTPHINFLKQKLIMEIKHPVKLPMDDFTAVGIAEGFIEEDASDERKAEAWQYLLDTGLCWKLQGWFGRTAMELINKGVIKEKVN